MRSMVESESETEVEPVDSEITLGMASLLGIFFGLVVLCGVFFGLGYSMGHRANAAATAPAVAPPKAATGSSAAVGATGVAVIPPSRLSASEAGSTQTPADDEVQSSTPVPSPDAAQEQPAAPTARTQEGQSAAEQRTLRREAAPTRRLPPAALPTAIAPAAIAPESRPAHAAPSTGSPSMVQIAAVSHPADADVLIAALRKHGYNASARTEPQDKLLHVQIGPFATRAEANAMRQKLLSDGYNAILK